MEDEKICLNCKFFRRLMQSWQGFCNNELQKIELNKEDRAMIYGNQSCKYWAEKEAKP